MQCAAMVSYFMNLFFFFPFLTTYAYLYPAYCICHSHPFVEYLGWSDAVDFLGNILCSLFLSLVTCNSTQTANQHIVITQLQVICKFKCKPQLHHHMLYVKPIAAYV